MQGLDSHAFGLRWNRPQTQRDGLQTLMERPNAERLEKIGEILLCQSVAEPKALLAFPQQIERIGDKHVTGNPHHVFGPGN